MWRWPWRRYTIEGVSMLLTGNMASMCCPAHSTAYGKFEGIVKGVKSAGTEEPSALLVASQAHKRTEVCLCKSVSGGHKIQHSCRNYIDILGRCEWFPFNPLDGKWDLHIKCFSLLYIIDFSVVVRNQSSKPFNDRCLFDFETVCTFWGVVFSFLHALNWVRLVLFVVLIKLLENMFEISTYAASCGFQLVVICTHGAAMHSINLEEIQHRNIQHYP